MVIKSWRKLLQLPEEYSFGVGDWSTCMPVQRPVTVIEQPGRGHIRDCGVRRLHSP